MILTDGEITDIDKTIDSIVKGSDYPLSIIIVGVGDNEFESMNRLDGDMSPLYSDTLDKYCSRDIVQFVPFAKYKDNPMELAKVTLGELPKQLVDFF